MADHRLASALPWYRAPIEAAPAAATAGSRTTATLVALTVTLGLAAVAWIVAVWQMTGMDKGVVTTERGSFSYFTGVWIAMMAAMMLPGAAPAVARSAQLSGRLATVPLFVASYLTVWALVGIAVYTVYRPHAPLLAGVIVIAAGVYELIPVKHHFRRRCRDSVRSGLRFGLCCVGSSLGLMLVLVALGFMSLIWMSLITLVVLTQKLLPARAAIDVPLAVALVAFGIWIAVAPATVPGLMPSM
jgi:predicted metal-binding membrane protein